MSIITLKSGLSNLISRKQITYRGLSHHRVLSLASQFPLLEREIFRTPTGIIYIDLCDFSSFEAVLGQGICDQILFTVGNVLTEHPITFFGRRKKISVSSLGGDDFLIFIDAPTYLSGYETEISSLKSLLERSINEALQQLEIGRQLTLHLGYSEVQCKPGTRVDSAVYKAIKEATRLAKNSENQAEQAQRHLLRTIIDYRLIKVVYQPIVSLKSGEVFGFEALSRGPSGCELEYPMNLFKTAEHHNMIFDLEKICREIAVENASKMDCDRYLFLNINPLVLKSLNHEKGHTRSLLNDFGLDVNKVILEITERTAIQDYTSFREALKYYRNQGFLIAIDDAGAGYSSMEAIVELQPEFVKIDMSVVRDIDSCPTKRALFESLMDFAGKINSHIIAEGIETEKELKVLLDAGCEFGQGFLLARPGNIENKVNPLAYEIIEANARKSRIYHPPTCRIGDLKMYQAAISPDTPVYMVVDMFSENKTLNGIVVCTNEIPIGLVMRERLFTMLGSRYGYNLFMKRPVLEIMDSNPLIVSNDMQVEDAAHLVAEKLDHGVTDHVVVVHNGSYTGVVSVAQILTRLAKIQIEQAKDANPLTGLPGNRCITQRITDELLWGNNFTILYLDLDNFKAFNDKYGFEYGDQVLAYMGNMIINVVADFGNKEDFVGHIGGDDFVVITSPDRAHGLASELITAFDKNIEDFYDETLFKQGFILAHDREGQCSKIPIMSLSIAGVSCPQGLFSSYLQIGEVAAEVKKWAKSTPGSCYRENRRGLVSSEKPPLAMN